MPRIRAEILIPGRGEPISDGAVIVDSGVITFAGPAAQAPAGDDEIIEVASLMPGIWDCHIHFMGLVVPNIESVATTSAVQAGARSSTDLRMVLESGVTSVREVGGYGADLAPLVLDGTLPGPTIYGAGAILSTTGGHADVHALPLDFYESMSRHGRVLGRLCDGVPECLRAVREQLRRNAQVIKVCASGGVMSEVDHPIHQQFSAEELEAIVMEAARAERVVAAHCHGKPGIMAALLAGVKTIEHGSYLDEEAAALMIEREAVLVPTRFVIEESLQMEDELPDYAWRKMTAIAEQHRTAMRMAVEMGVTIATGTDLGTSGPRHGYKFGTGTSEIRHLMDAGMTALKAIEAATANGPLTIGKQAPQAGQLKQGFVADMVAFDGDPTSDLTIWGDASRVSQVWKAGTAIKTW